MTDLKIILENIDDICERFEMEGLHTHPTYKQFKRLFAELKVANDQPAGYTAVDMTTAAAQGFRDGAASLLPVLEMARSYVGFEGSDAELAQLEAAISAVTSKEG